MVVPTIFLKSRVYCIVHWNDLSTNEINKVLFFSEGQKCFVLGWRSQNSDETKYHLHISETFISTICSLDSNIRFIKPPKAQQLCWFPTVEASLDKVRIFWEGQKIWKNLPRKIWRYWVASNFKWKIFSNFVALSEYPNFIYQSIFVNNKVGIRQN